MSERKVIRVFITVPTSLREYEFEVRRAAKKLLDWLDFSKDVDGMDLHIIFEEGEEERE